jgi:hypothetical protein
VICKEFGREIDINMAFERFCNTFGKDLGEIDEEVQRDHTEEVYGLNMRFLCALNEMKILGLIDEGGKK